MLSDKPVVGFLGLGSLGGPIARRIGSRYPLVVFDRDMRKAENLAGKISVAHSAAEVGSKADLVFACLGPEADYRAALLGPDGLCHASGFGTYVHLGTSGPRLVEEFARKLADCNVALVDAPVTGGPPLARTGQLTAMVSGPEDSILIARPIMEAYASRIIEAGRAAGDAQAVKLVNNAIALTNLAVACEALMVGAKRGLCPEMMLEVINHGSGQNSATLTKVSRQILTRRFDFGATLGTVIKDLELFHEEAHCQGVPDRITQMTLEAFRMAAREGVEIDDLTSVIRPLERTTHIELTRSHINETL